MYVTMEDPNTDFPKVNLEEDRYNYYNSLFQIISHENQNISHENQHKPRHIGQNRKHRNRLTHM